MQEFIPLEDDWSLLEAIAEHRLVPYQVGMACVRRARQLWSTPSEPGAAAVISLRRHSHWPRDLG